MVRRRGNSSVAHNVHGPDIQFSITEAIAGRSSSRSVRSKKGGPSGGASRRRGASTMSPGRTSPCESAMLRSTAVTVRIRCARASGTRAGSAESRIHSAISGDGAGGSLRVRRSISSHTEPSSSRRSWWRPGIPQYLWVIREKAGFSGFTRQLDYPRANRFADPPFQSFGRGVFAPSSGAIKLIVLHRVGGKNLRRKPIGGAFSQYLLTRTSDTMFDSAHITGLTSYHGVAQRFPQRGTNGVFSSRSRWVASSASSPR
jgi:hypothetical protein